MRYVFAHFTRDLCISILWIHLVFLHTTMLLLCIKKSQKFKWRPVNCVCVCMYAPSAAWSACRRKYKSMIKINDQWHEVSARAFILHKWAIEQTLQHRTNVIIFIKWKKTKFLLKLSWISLGEHTYV